MQAPAAPPEETAQDAVVAPPVQVPTVVLPGSELISYLRSEGLPTCPVSEGTPEQQVYSAHYYAKRRGEALRPEDLPTSVALEDMGQCSTTRCLGSFSQQQNRFLYIYLKVRSIAIEIARRRSI